MSKWQNTFTIGKGVLPMRTQPSSLFDIMSTDIASKIRALIDSRDLKDTALAKAVGVHSSAINRWTTRREDYKPGESVRRPSSEQLLKIARYFGVSMEYLVDPTMETPDTGITPDERAVLAAYRVQRRLEGDTFTPEELAWRIRLSRSGPGEGTTLDGRNGQAK